MLDDYLQVIREAHVQVAVLEGRVVGVVVMRLTDEGFYIENVAVRLAVKGKGVGRALLVFAEAEARSQGYASLYLATHELMVENRAQYAAWG